MRTNTTLVALQAVRRDGARRLAARALRAAGDRLAGGVPDPLPVRTDHLLAPAGGPPRGWRPRRQGPLVIDWIANPPGEVSGGMSTLMHTIELLEGRGHDCRVSILYTGLRRDLERDRQVARERFPQVRASFHDFDDGLRDADAVVATAWPTAYALRASRSPGVRFYLVQDHEPSFYPASSASVLAEDTYRFGFYGITAGRWLATMLSREFDMAATAFDLGVDLSCYRLPERDADGEDRRGVVFYARPDTARRGFELGMAALALFSARHPGTPIHLVGQDLSLRDVGFEATVHGRCSPRELAAIYQRCAAGLVLSLTNLSLVPAELLACGCVPVLNDDEHVRVAFDNPFARYTAARPEALAGALGAVVDDRVTAGQRRAIAASVEALGWEHVADRLELALGRGLARHDELVAQTWGVDEMDLRDGVRPSERPAATEPARNLRR